MIQRGFDIDAFANKMKVDSAKVFSQELPSTLRDFISNLIFDFINIAGNALAQEKTFYSKEQTILICQLIAEWTYHKGIDNYKNQIPEEYWKPILQQIAFSVFESSKKTISQNKTQDEVINDAEAAIIQKYKVIIEGLIKENKIQKSLNEIMQQSNLQDYVDKIDNENTVIAPQNDNTNTSNNFNQPSDINNNFTIPAINDIQILKAKMQDLQTSTLAFRYFIRAGKVLKSNGFNKTTRQQILYYFSCCTKDVISYISVEDFKWTDKDINRILLTSMEILLNKIVILRNANIPIENFTELINIITNIVYAVELQFIKDKNKLSETFRYTKMGVEHHCNKELQELADKKIITKNQLYMAKNKSHIVYLDNDIKEFDGKRNFFSAKKIVLIIIILTILRLLIRVGVIYFHNIH